MRRPSSSHDRRHRSAPSNATSATATMPAACATLDATSTFALRLPAPTLTAGLVVAIPVTGDTATSQTTTGWSVRATRMIDHEQCVLDAGDAVVPHGTFTLDQPVHATRGLRRSFDRARRDHILMRASGLISGEPFADAIRSRCEAMRWRATSAATAAISCRPITIRLPRSASRESISRDSRPQPNRTSIRSSR